MTDTTDIRAIINRHMARLLSDLETADCPRLFRDAVKSGFVWLRSDLCSDNEREEPHDARGNQ